MRLLGGCPSDCRRERLEARGHEQDGGKIAPIKDSHDMCERRVGVSGEEGNQVRTSTFRLLTGEKDQVGKLPTVNSPQVVAFDWWCIPSMGKKCYGTNPLGNSTNTLQVTVA